jgi:hypothetical protein
MKKEPWRWIVFGLAVAYIAYMWISKAAGSSLPAEDLLPMAVTGIAVTAVKVIAIACGILLLKYILSKLKK